MVGYSFAGMVAQELAIGWPQRVDRLVLAATTAGGAGGSSYPIQACWPDLTLCCGKTGHATNESRRFVWS